MSEKMADQQSLLNTGTITMKNKYKT
jgi:hypothetical protein